MRIPEQSDFNGPGPMIPTPTISPVEIFDEGSANLSEVESNLAFVNVTT